MKIENLKEKDCVYKEVEERIDANKEKKDIYNIFHKSFKILIFVSGASITILSGLEFPDYKTYCLVISAGITLLTAIEGLFNLRNKAMSYDLLLYDLRSLRNEICYQYLENEEQYNKNRGRYFQQLQNILAAKKKIIEDSFDDEVTVKK